MAKQNQVKKAKSDEKRQPRSKPAFIEELTGDLAGLAQLSGGSIQAQAARLGDTRLQTAQRRAVAAHIGRVQGNHHLQRVVAAANGNGKKAPYQSNGGRRDGREMSTGKTALRGSEQSEEVARLEEQFRLQTGRAPVQRDVALGPGQFAPQAAVGRRPPAYESSPVIQRRDDAEAGLSQRPLVQRQQTAAKVRRAKRLFSWLEKPLQSALNRPGKKDGWKKISNSTDDAVAGLVLIYNKMRNENVWQYVEEITWSSPQISVCFKPKGGQASLPKRLAKHGYSDCLASWGCDWGVRKEKVSGAHLHFKHVNSSDVVVNVHVDKVNPCSGSIPILSRIYNALRHLHVDKIKWSKRKPRQFLKLLKKQGVPLSTGVLGFLRKKGYL